MTTTRKQTRHVYVSDTEWARLRAIAARMGCFGQHGGPSVSIMLQHVSGYRIRTVAAADLPSRSIAERVRRAIAENPGADDKTIAEAVGCEPLYVYQVRRRAAATATRKAKVAA